MFSLAEKIRAVMRIRPEDNVHPEVAKNFKHNVITNTVDITFFFFADSFVNLNTIMTVFAATLTRDPMVIGLIPAIATTGWYLPQLFMAGYVSRLSKKMPVCNRMGAVERLPYLFLPLLAISIPKLGNEKAATLLLILTTFRGLFAGLMALPWQELTASVIPMSHRSRYWGLSRVSGQIAGMIGSVISAILLAKLPYPTNFAVGFSIAVVAQWISFYFFSRNREPDIPEEDAKPAKARTLLDLQLFGNILREDHNFVLYLIGRSLLFIGSMGSAFLAVYGIERFSLGQEQAGVFTGLLFASGIIGYAVWGTLGDRIGPKRVITLAESFWVLSILIVLVSPSPLVYYLAFIFFGIANSGLILGDAILVMELGDERLRPTYLGMARTLTGAFLLLAPVIAGAVIRASGYPLMFGASLAFSLLGTVLMNRVKDRPRQTRVAVPASSD